MRRYALITTLMLLSLSQEASAQIAEGVYTIRQLPTAPAQGTIHIPNGR